MARWVHICQQCFEEEFPSEYCPELTDWDTCGVCGQDGLIANISPKRLEGNI